MVEFYVVAFPVVMLRSPPGYYPITPTGFSQNPCGIFNRRDGRFGRLGDVRSRVSTVHLVVIE
jgi:hypothetical protein